MASLLGSMDGRRSGWLLTLATPRGLTRRSTYIGKCGRICRQELATSNQLSSGLAAHNPECRAGTPGLKVVASLVTGLSRKPHRWTG